MNVTRKALIGQRIPTHPRTIGEHVKKRRYELGLSQQAVADILGVCESTVLNWETDATVPLIAVVPRIMRFLGYDPYPLSATLSERMLAKRRAMGWSIAAAAKHVGVDPSAWGHWERTGIIAWKRYRDMLEAFLLQVH